MVRLRALVIFAVSLALATGSGGNVHAQFLKGIFGKKHSQNTEDSTKAGNNDPKKTENGAPKLSRKERKKKHREEKRKQKQERKLKNEQKKKDSKKKQDATKKSGDKKQNKPAKDPLVPHKRKQEVLYPTTKFKNSYRINVLLPLYLDELVKGESVTFKDKVPEKAVQGIAFYEGVKLAADSLKKAGFNLDIYINDVGSYSESPDNLINDRKFDSTDLIIGAVQQHDIPTLAAYAKKKKINFVSALSPNDGYVKNNQYFTMLQPSLRSHCEFIIDDMSKKYPGQKVALLYRTSSPNDENTGQYMLTDNYSEVEFKKLLCNTLPGKDALLSVFDTTKPNIVVMTILDNGFADSLLRELAHYFPCTHFEVYGMPTWTAITNLRKANVYNNLTINVTYPFNIEPADGSMMQVVERSYKKEYGGKPQEMVFRGYETLFWYANLLKQYGTIFNTNYKDNSKAPFTKFEVKPRWDGNGSLLFNENRHIYLSTYQGGVYKTE